MCNLNGSLILGVCLLCGCGFSLQKPCAPTGIYDLTCKVTSISPATIYVGDKVVFSYSVSNLGSSTLPARTYDVDFYVNGSLVSFDHATSSLIAGGSTSYSMEPPYYHFDAKAPGQYSYKLLVDPTNRVPETDENNNVVVGSFVVNPKVP